MFPYGDTNVCYKLFNLIILHSSGLFVHAMYVLHLNLIIADLAWCDPWPKFLCIKGVVFMTFWQYVVLQMMSGMVRFID